ncbi:MAG: hypothetical protein JAZ12_13425 [Candidatus Thiodiazotropha taylori]|nr:hypothetical protein [Candidatus Thiodiazotropha taylori]
MALRPPVNHQILISNTDEWRENSVPLNIHLYSYQQPVRDAVSNLYNRLYRELTIAEELTYDIPEDKFYVKSLPRTEGRQKNTNQILNMIVMNCYHRYLTSNGHGSIGVSFDNNKYTKKSRYNAIGVTRTTLHDVYNALCDSGYLYSRKATPGSTNNISSRFSATEELIEFLQSYDINPNMIEEYSETEVIEITEKIIDGRGVERKIYHEYDDTDTTHLMRADLHRYKNHLKAQTIECTTYTQFTKVDTYRAKRVFNNETDFSLGGRIYAGFWQNMPSEHRQNIVLNGQRTVELDYINCQLKILYALEDEFYQEDGYILDGYQDNIGRDLLKKVLLIALNTPSKNSAVAAFNTWMGENRQKRNEVYNYYVERDIRPGRLIDQFTDKHEKLNHHFFTESGLSIMRIDSDICMSIINKFIEMDKPILTIHDSFVVTEQDEELLRQTMKSQFELHTQIEIDNVDALIKKEN